MTNNDNTHSSNLIVEQFCQDYEHYSSIIKRGVANHTEIRNASVFLRRMLLNENQFNNQILAKRKASFSIEYTSNKFWVENTDHFGLQFFVSGGALFGSFQFGEICQYRKNGPANAPKNNATSEKPSKFLQEKVLFFKGTWITRKEVIYFVANKFGGAHNSKLSGNKDKKLAEMASTGLISQTGSIEFHLPEAWNKLPQTQRNKPKFTLSERKVDPVLYELFCSLSLFLNSPDTVRVHSELCSSPSS